MESNQPRLADASSLCDLCLLLVDDVIDEVGLSEPLWTDSLNGHDGDFFNVVNSHHVEIRNLEQSASGGCRLCQFLRECLAMPEWKLSVYSTDLYYIHPGSGPGTFVVCKGHSDCALHGITFYFFDRYSSSELADVGDLKYGVLLRKACNYWWYYGSSTAMFIARGTCPDPSSVTTLALLNRWLKDCKTGHKECKRSDLQAPLPTRVIDVGTKDSDPFLYTSLGENADYITLSYAWGGDVLSKTTKSNLRERQQAIHEATLPQAFWDAFFIARELKIQYIWIDALCIVQDDPEDWSRESVLMSHIYENCTLTISATKSSKCESGFLQARENLEQDIGAYLDGFKRSLFVRVAQSNVHQIQGPLNYRGWTFQERFLSPAVLHFTDDGIYWECRSMCVNDSGATLSCSSELKAMSIPKERFYGQVEEYESTSGFGNLWISIVEKYCKRTLTFPEDKLIALSGIAQRYQVRMNQKYVAGLWGNNLKYWLLWQRSKTVAPGLQVLGQRSRIYRAPSWSWASLDGYLKYDRLLFEQDHVPCPSLPFQIQNYCIQEETPGACGKLSYGHLTITGMLYEATYTIISHHAHQEQLHTEIGTWDCMMDTLIYPEGSLEIEENYWVMPVAMWRLGITILPHQFRLFGLVLGRPRDIFHTLPGNLMRLGIAKMRLSQDGLRLRDKAKYKSKRPSIDDILDQSKTFTDHFPDIETRPEEHKMGAEKPSCFYSSMRMEEDVEEEWEKTMSALQFDRSKIRTVIVV
ncbi:heterokaryon incompatibility protein-domain-containing protein [Rhexocercosporidium sp. MPI-PUGE-AT-0058]|nr:heterokaryon incompatibility protein-domain-containing protein [Rhexocercosporidium sp. MPI-PUGE-AT-0058]